MFEILFWYHLISCKILKNGIKQFKTTLDQTISDAVYAIMSRSAESELRYDGRRGPD